MRILVVDDDSVSRNAVHDFLELGLGHEVLDAESGSEALQVLHESQVDAVITDVRMSDMDGLTLLKKIRADQKLTRLAVVLMTGFADVDSAIDAVRHGAFDYLRKPIESPVLTGVIERLEHHLDERESVEQADVKEMLESSSEGDNNYLYIDIPDYGTLGVFSYRMREIYSNVLRMQEDPLFPVLIEGETGTGKEGIARLVHHGKGRNPAPFISINCPAIAPNLFEAELFGYEEGAFTGASRKGRKGKLEMAQGGTLFLDEIGDLPLDLQPKLLRVLQEREIYRVGGDKLIPLSVRIIAATNSNLEEMVTAGKFRQDLYYRLNLGRVKLLPLREMKSSILPMAYMFLRRFAIEKNRSFRFISPEASEMLQGHNWPGNVRELLNAMERVVLLHDDDVVRPEYISQIGGIPQSFKSGSQGGFRIEDIRLPEDEFLLRDVERIIIEKAFRKFEGNKSKIARYLGISRNTLMKRVEELDL